KASAALEAEVHTRIRAEEELQQCRARLQSCEAQAGDLTRVTSLLQEETAARQHTEEKLHEAQAQLHAGETQLADLIKAKAMLQETVQTAERSLSERSTELANVKASLQDESAARQRAEEAREDYRIQ